MDAQTVWNEINVQIALCEGTPTDGEENRYLAELLISLGKWIQEGGKWPSP